MNNGWTLMHKTLEDLRAIILDDTQDEASRLHLGKATLETYDREKREIINQAEEKRTIYDPRD